MIRARFLRVVLFAVSVVALLLTLPGEPRAGEAQTSGGILEGSLPPPGDGFGTFAYAGGPFTELLAGYECPPATATFFHNTAAGDFVVWIPASQVAVVNRAMMALFPSDHVPLGTLFTARCGPTTISLGPTIGVSGRGALANADGVMITVAGSYEINGTLPDGMIEVHAPEGDVELVLAGSSITNLDGPAIYFADTRTALVTIEAGTTNTLTDSGSSELDAVLYAQMDLTIRGEGALTVTANNLEGISSTAGIAVEGGQVRVYAREDGLSASTDDVSSINVSGGYLYVQSVSGDGIDSNGTLTITAGTVISLGSLDDESGGLDSTGPLTIDGGTVIATGVHFPPPSPQSAQRSILALLGRQPASTLLSIQTGGVQLLTFAPAAEFDHVFYSSSNIADGSYDVYLGGSASGVPVDGVYPTGTHTGGVLASTITTASDAY